jgi:cytochrome P450
MSDRKSRFSRRAILQQEPLVQGFMDFLTEKLKVYHKEDKIIALQKMFSALTCDVIATYTFGFNYNQLASEDFSQTFHQVFIEAGPVSNFTLHFQWIGQVCY